MKDPTDWVSWALAVFFIAGMIGTLAFAMYAPKSWGGADPYP